MDYRRLNSVSKIDAYPMPEVDELLDDLGKAHFISTMDLTQLRLMAGTSGIQG